jgi:3-isopropylmalate/(R)-2-methylmalate dehydratase small subunit
MILRGRVWKYGNDVNTDYIIPGRYMELTDPLEMATHAFEEHDPEFIKGVQNMDIVVSGKNFGCGSSREHAPLALKYAGISCVLAESFARIFYRNCINVGLPAMECPGIHEAVKKRDDIKVNVSKGTVINLFSGKELQFNPIPEFMLEILNACGLSPYLSKTEKW